MTANTSAPAIHCAILEVGPRAAPAEAQWGSEELVFLAEPYPQLIICAMGLMTLSQRRAWVKCPA